MNIARNPSEAAAKALLASSGLPTSDIKPIHMANFFGLWSGSTLVGVVGIEPFGSVALLRSLAVAASIRGSGSGSSLLEHAEREAAHSGAHSVFLLTTTAELFFARRGYCAVPREVAPAAIRNTTEFAGLCPSNSALMVKQLPVNTSLNPTVGADAPLPG